MRCVVLPPLAETRSAIAPRSRTFVSLVTGTVVGLLGIEGWWGFLPHIATQLLVSCMGEEAGMGALACMGMLLHASDLTPPPLHAPIRSAPWPCLQRGGLHPRRTSTAGEQWGWHAAKAAGWEVDWEGKARCMGPDIAPSPSRPLSHRRSNLLFSNVFSSLTLLSFMLFWMTFFNIAHVFA